MIWDSRAEVVQSLASFLAGMRGGLAERLFPRPIDTVAALGGFAGQRAAFVAQTALFGYLKTRMGTKFPQYFEDEVFAAAIKAAAVRQFASCAADLSTYATGLVAGDGRLAGGEATALARACFERALAAGVAPDDRALLPPAAEADFARRAEGVDWAVPAGEGCFAGSIADLIRNAPVIDAFKSLDGSIVGNSIRLRWLDVREQLVRRLRAEAVCADWRAAAAR